MKKIIMITVATLSVAMATPANKDGQYLDTAKDLIGSLSYTDKQAYIAEFKELNGNAEKAAWFKKVIVAETSTSNAINFALKGEHGDIVEAHMLESELITVSNRGVVKVNKDSDAYKALDAIRSEKWDKHVGNPTPPASRIPDIGVKPIDPGFGIDPKDPSFGVDPVDPGFAINPIIEIDPIDPGFGIDPLIPVEPIAPDRGELKVTTMSFTTDIDNGIKYLNTYAGVRMTSVEDNINSDTYGSVVAGVEATTENETFNLYAGVEAQVSQYGTASLAPIAGVRANITDNLSANIGIINNTYELEGHNDRQNNVTFGFRYKF